MEYLKNKIVSILTADSRVTPNEIAEMLTVSEEKIVNAINELEEQKVILGYTATINKEKLGDNVVALIEVKVTPQKGSGFEDIAKKICKYSQVRSCYLISGDYDFMVIVNEQNMKKVAEFVHEKLAVIDEVISTATHFVLKSYKESGIVFEEEEVDDRLVVSP